MRHQTFKIKGMHCASCAGNIEKTFKKLEGVHFAEVNYGTETAKVDFDETKITSQNLSEKIEPLGYSLIIPQEKVPMPPGHEGMSATEMGMSEDEHIAHLGRKQGKEEKLAELKSMKGQLKVAIPLAGFSILIMFWEILSEFGTIPRMSEVWMEFFHHLLPIMATYILLVLGKPYLLGFYRFLRYGKANMDTLIGIGTSVAFLYSFIVTAFEEALKPYINVEHTYYDVTIVVITFIALGKYLETRSKIKTGDAIEKLLNLQAKTAMVIREGKEIEIPVDQVVAGDKIVVKPAERIPVDGVLIEGNSFVDEAMVTGESIPAEKKVGSQVVAGTINTSGAFIFKATKVGSQTMLAHIITMVEEAQGSKAPIQGLADKISSVFVPIVLILSIIIFGLWLIIGTQYLGFSQALSFGLTSFVGILIIACPCALGLATPTAIIVGVGKGAQEGILIKDAATLEKLHQVDMVVVDKTGTLTKGKPEFINLKNFSEKKDAELISILASMENKSEHPIAHAIVSHAKENGIELENVTTFESLKGKGLKAIINDTKYYAGNLKLIEDLKLKFDIKSIEKETLEGKTPLILATKKEVLALVLVADQIKSEAIEAVKNLHALGIKVAMLTGDNKNTAQFIAKQIGIDQVMAEASPKQKLKQIKVWQDEGKVIAMVGDGVNDAPALAQANVGIAMATGTDVAIETAGITLLKGDISKLVKAVKLSKITMRGIKQNLFWAFFYNVVGIPLAAGILYPLFGWMLSPIFAGMAMALSSVSVVGNSLRIKAKKL